VSEKKPLRFGRIGDGTAIKAFSFIPHHNRYFSTHAESAAQMTSALRRRPWIEHGCHDLVFGMRGLNLR
jgi:hypothetical protein